MLNRAVFPLQGLCALMHPPSSLAGLQPAGQLVHVCIGHVSTRGSQAHRTELLKEMQWHDAQLPPWSALPCLPAQVSISTSEIIRVSSPAD